MIKNVKKVQLRDIYSDETLSDILEHKSVMISPEILVNNIINYHYQFNLIESGEDVEFSLLAVPANIRMNMTFKSNIRNM